MTRLARAIAAAIAAACITLALTACSDDDDYQTRPPAYGAAGQCYYIDSVAEAIALQQAGLCPVNWAPVPMPISWRNQYAWYYDSPRYYDRYVPAQRRTTYVANVHVYESRNPSAVRATPKLAAPPKPASSFRSGTGRSGGDVGTSRSSTGSKSSFSSGSRSGGGSSSGRSSSGGSSFRSGSRR